MALTGLIPKHVAIVMDGNGRWAKQRGLPRVAGHKAGVDAVHRSVRYCLDRGIQHLTIFAFSTENWQRSTFEVNALKELFFIALSKEIKELKKQGVRMRFIGDLQAFGDRLQARAKEAEAITCTNNKLEFIIALNYSGRWDICHATQLLAAEVAAHRLTPQEITSEKISHVLATSGTPDPELYIRTSGEQRLSNFLLWQLAYSELYFCDIFWPDFNEIEFDKAIAWYQQRDRRFDKVKEQEEA